MADTCHAFEEKEGEEGEHAKGCQQSKSIHTLTMQIGGGCKQFDDHQSKACKCVPKAKAQRRRGSELTAFYKAHNPAKLSQV
jgi:hypothetical protein